MSETDDLEDVYERFYEHMVDELDEGADPLVVSGSLLAIAIRLYRTVLNDNDFEKVLNAIPNNVDVKPYDEGMSRTLH